MVEENQHLVTRQDRGNVTYLSLNRPQQGNSLLLATMEALHNRLLALRSETSIGVIVLSGVGQRIFCAGHDLKEFTAEIDPDVCKTVSMRCSAILQAVREQPQIVIARVEGFASAAGCQLVASADLAIPSNGAKFATPGLKLGLWCLTPMIALGRRSMQFAQELSKPICSSRLRNSRKIYLNGQRCVLLDSRKTSMVCRCYWLRTLGAILRVHRYLWTVCKP